MSASTESAGRQILANGVLGDVSRRKVAAPGFDEALLRIHATSIDFHDLVGIHGGIPNLPVPRVPFSDASATIAAIGDGVTAFAVGDAVIPSFFWNWQAGPPTRASQSIVLGDQVDGTLQTHVVVPARSLVAAAKGLSHDEIATLSAAPPTWPRCAAPSNKAPIIR